MFKSLYELRSGDLILNTVLLDSNFTTLTGAIALAIFGHKVFVASSDLDQGAVQAKVFAAEELPLAGQRNDLVEYFEYRIILNQLLLIHTDVGG
jgi:hypothetical protein